MQNDGLIEQTEKRMLEKYQVVISGRTLDGAPLSSVKAEVGEAFHLRDEQLDRMLSGKPRVVSRSTTAEGAERLLARLRALGLEAHAELLAENRDEAPSAPRPGSGNPPASRPAAGNPPQADGQELFALAGPQSPAHNHTAAPMVLEALPADGVTCPKCGESQPKRTLCRACGLDMPRYLASKEAEEREQREARTAELAARRPGTAALSRPGGDRPALLSLGFAGRFGRLDYFAASLFSTLLWLIPVWLAVVTGKNAFAGLGMLLSFVYALRCIALRLHDTGRTGWMALIAVVPVIGALMALALLFIGGEEEHNEYGPAPAEAGVGRALLTLAACVAVSGFVYGAITDSPERMMRFAQAMGAGEDSPAFDEEMGEAPFQDEPVRYARSNRIDIYVIAGCGDCDAMLAWLHGNGLHPAVYHVDSDRQAAERLHAMIGGTGRIQLPVLEVNGEVLPGNPAIGEVHEYLRQAEQ
ncbi:DUF805 domain-containing protein [Pseudothauera nasutitermitis]|uniref:DUF805 domain-containing protein n=1 Tax=Pseudothauera nasutitermitis TaxID=2565930 RepID=UPI001454E3C1|nr:DUF805 domain-containing protein [Pseudothauera nasutitermitis]